MRARIFDDLTTTLLSRRVAVLCLLVALALVAAIWAPRAITLDADTDSLIGESQPFMADYRRFKHDFGDLEYLIVVVDAMPPGATSPRHAEAKSAVMALITGLERVPGLRQVHGVISADEQMRLAPWSPQMSEHHLAGLVKASDAFGGIIERHPAATLLRDAESRLDRLLPGTGVPLDRASQEREGAAAIFTLRAIAAGAASDHSEFPLASLPEDRFLSKAEPPAELGRFLFVTILPQKDYGSLSVIEEPLRRIRAVIADVQAQVPDVEIGLTGKPVLQADEMSTTNNDMTRAAIVGVVLVSLLFMLVFRSVRRPLLAVLAFGVGAALTYGAAAVLVGRLNLLSLVFMLVLVGVGLDYGIHMVARYSEGRPRLGRRDAIRHMMRTAVPSNVTGAAIAGGTFLIALLTPFQGLRELGLIAGVGLLICMVVMALLLPVLLDLFDKDRTARNSYIMGRERPPGVDHGAFSGRHAAIAIIAIAGAVLFGLVGPSAVRFESNLLKLQADSVAAVKWEMRIIDHDASETWFGAAIVDSLAALPPLVAAAGTEPAIGAVRSVLDLVAMPTPERDALRAQLAAATNIDARDGTIEERPRGLAATAVEAAPSSSSDPSSPSTIDPAEVRRVAGKVDRLSLLAAIAAPDEARSMRELSARLQALADGLDPRRHDSAMVAAREQAVADALRATAHWLVQMGVGARGSLRDALPAAVRDEFTSANGLYCVRLHPAKDVWEFEPMHEFVAAMRRVDPRVTGVPITQYESMLLLERSFLIQAVAASIFVAIVLFIDLRRVSEVLLCLVALAVGLAWTLGAMVLFGVDFNLANFFGVPIALGLGSDACIHIAHRAREGLHAGFGSTRRAVTVTALTTVIGFGGLLFAQHRGLQSLGVLMVISTLAMLAAATLVLPALLRGAARLRSRS